MASAFREPVSGVQTNQSALRLKARLLFEPGVMVTSVPWQLRSAAESIYNQPEVAVGTWPEQERSALDLDVSS